MNAKRKTVLESIMDGVTKPLPSTEGSAAPFPQVVGAAGEPWKVSQMPEGGQAYADLGKREVLVPYGTTPLEAAIRLHEIGHVRLTDPNALADMAEVRDQIDAMWMNVCEDCRIESTLCRDEVLAEVMTRPDFLYDVDRLKSNADDLLRAAGSYDATGAPEGVLTGMVETGVRMCVSRAGSNREESERLLDTLLSGVLGEDYSQFIEQVEQKVGEWIDRLSDEGTSTQTALDVAREITEWVRSGESRPQPNPQPDPEGEKQEDDSGSSDGDAESDEDAESEDGYSDFTERERARKAREDNIRSWADYTNGKMPGGGEAQKEAERLERQAAQEAARRQKMEQREGETQRSDEPSHGWTDKDQPWHERFGDPPLGMSGFEGYEFAPEGAVPEGVVEWAKMNVQRAEMSNHTTRKGERRSYHLARGGAVRDVHRVLVDGKVFRRRLRGHGKQWGAMLLDISGSMSVSHSQIQRALEVSPAATIAAYSGSGDEGNLIILAENGRSATKEEMRKAVEEWGWGGNQVDLPALEWLSRQRGPKVWVSDAQVYPWQVHEELCPMQHRDALWNEPIGQCLRLQVRHKIHRVHSYNDLLEDATNDTLRRLR